jgi:hypothetical protein
MFTRGGEPARARKTDEPIESETESDSESSASSDASEIDEESKADGKDWVAKMKEKKATSSKTAEGKVTKSAAVTSPKVKAKSLDTKPGLKEVEASESSASESDSESDEDGDIEMERKDMNGGNADATGQRKQETESNADSNSESSADESEPAPNGAKVAGKADLASKNGAVSEEESTSESESESASEDEQEAPQHSKEKAPSASESDSESESEDEPEPPRKPKEKTSTQVSEVSKEASNSKKVVPAKPPKQSSVNGTGRSQEFVSKSDMSDSEDEEDAVQPMAVEKAGEKTPVSVPREIVAQGFHLRKAEEDVDAATVAQAFKKAKAEGKQIWYFTAPKSVPIEVIQKHAIPFDKIHAGEPILTHGGADYTAHFEQAADHAIKVLIPGKTGTNYETCMSNLGSILWLPT